MIQYIIRRLLWMIVLLFLVSALTFMIFYALPVGRPGGAAGRQAANPQLVEQIRKQPRPRPSAATSSTSTT